MDSFEVGEMMVALQKAFYCRGSSNGGKHAVRCATVSKYVRQDCDSICRCGRPPTMLTIGFFLNVKCFYIWLPFSNSSKILVEDHEQCDMENYSCPMVCMQCCKATARKWLGPQGSK